jgi:hypothetical protein
MTGQDVAVVNEDGGPDRGAASGGWTLAAVLSRVGLLLLPVLALLLAAEVGRGVEWIVHGITDGRLSAGASAGDVAFGVIGALVGPIAVALIWFDWLRTGLERRQRLSLVGWLGSAVAGAAVMALLPLADQYLPPL